MRPISDSIAIKVGVAAALLLLAVIAGTSLVRMNRFADGAQWVNHTHEVIEGLDAVLMAITDAEAGQRGFLLTADESYLAPYHASRVALAAKLERAKKLIADSASQSQRIAQVQALAEQRIELLEEGITVRRATQGPLRLGPEHFIAGRDVMQNMRAVITSMKDDELQLLRTRSAAFKHERATARLIIVVGNGVALAMLVTSFVIVLREARQRQEAELRARRYAVEVEDLYNAAPCGYHSLDAEGVIVRINDTELTWLGYSREEIINRKRLAELLSPDSRARFEHSFVKFKQDGVAHDLEYDMVRKDGTILPVAISATLVRDASGGYLMSRSTLFDITARKRAEQELHETNAFLDSVLEHIPSTIFVKDARELRYVRLNSAGERLFELSREAVLGKNDQELFTLEQAIRYVAQDREVLSSGRMLDLAEDVLPSAGGERILHTRKLQINDGAGSARYLLGISEDVTERRLAERKIGELNGALELRAQQLEATNKELESFSYSVSHDLRSPLRAIDGFSRILEEDHAARLDEEGVRLLSVIRDNTRRMAQLIDDLLAFSHLGRQAIALLDVKMDALARETWEQLRSSERVTAVQLNMNTLPDAVGDPVLLRQVWTNLLSNAIKYSGTRERPVVEVSARLQRGHLVYCVSDNGVGFDMRYGDKLFGVFQRLHSMDEFPGTGVGLAIVKRVVTRHGGRVWAEAVLDRGAQFYFSLPERRNG